MRKLKVLSLFAGIGGLELGLEMTGGFETCLQVEIEEYPLKVLRTRWPNVKRWDDVRTLFAAGSPARTFPSLESEKVLTVRAPVFGKSTGESFAKYDRPSSSWKTSVGCFPWGSDEFSETWPSSGMMRNGRCFRLRPKGLRTAGKGSSSWPTPQAIDGHPSFGNFSGEAARKTMAGGHAAPLSAQVKMREEDAKMWPTPEKADGQRGSLGHMRGNPTLLGAARMWPTPKSEPSGPDFARAGREGSGGDDLATAAARTALIARQESIARSFGVEDVLEIFQCEKCQRVFTGDRCPDCGGAGTCANPSVLYQRTWPAVQDSANNAGPSQWERNSDPLDVAVKRIPTPRAGGHLCGGSGSHGRLEEMRERGEITEDERKAMVGSGQLNPGWVETLMGFPVGWSDVDCVTPEARDYRTRWQDGTWEEGLPRLTTRKDLRRQRLMALGNGVVPQCAETIGRAILRVLT